MEYKDIRENLEEMMNDNYKDFIKALVSIEKGVNDEKALEEVYVLYMNNDTTGLLSDDFDYMIDDMKEQGKIVENTNELEEKDDLINLVGNISGKVENLERENANGEKFKVSNFSIVSKDDDGNKVYTNCSAYGDKTKDLKNLKQGDFVKIFGQVKTSIDNNGKEHKNVRILSSKLLKAKEELEKQTKDDKDKKSILGQIKRFKTDDKTKSTKKDHNKGAER
ncbi:TPA: DNA-binding protein [Streptococcus agalactiae]